MQAALEAQARLQGHEQRMAELQKEVDSAQRLMRSAQSQAREAADEKGALTDKVRAVCCAVLCHTELGYAELYSTMNCAVLNCCCMLCAVLLHAVHAVLRVSSMLC